MQTPSPSLSVTLSGRRAAPLLRCVALPVIAPDLDGALEEIFRLWSDPRFAPVTQAQTHRPHLMVMVNRAPPEALAEAEALFARYPRLAASFCGMSAHSADLTGARDLYTKARHGFKGGYGSRAGPNFLFHHTLEQAQGWMGADGDDGFTLQIELDCLPVQAGWIEASQQVIDGNARAWVIGSVFAGPFGDLDHSIQTHMNGNALYRTGNRSFRRFLSKVWMPRLFEHARIRRDLAYDCWWALERSQANAKAGGAAWELFQTYEGFFHTDPFIVNLLDGTDAAQAYARIFDKFNGLDRPPVFFHGAAMGPVRAALLQDAGLSIFDVIDALDPPRPKTGAEAEITTAAALARPRPPLRRAEALPDLPDPASDWLSDPDPAHLRLWARAVATGMLVDPAPLAARLADPADLARALARVRIDLPPDDPARAHLERVLAEYGPNS